MPYFSSKSDTIGGGGLASSLKRAIGGLGGGLGPMQEIEIDRMAADTAHKLTMAEQVRLKTEEIRRAAALRSDPNAQSKFASDYAGTDQATGRRIFGNLRGEKEPWNVADQDDADVTGVALVPDTMAMPNVDPSIARRFQDAHAALGARDMATAPTNAEQLLHAARRVGENRVFGKAEAAADRGDVSQVNLQSAGVLHGRELTPHKTSERGFTTNEYTGARDESGGMATASRDELVAKAGRERAAAAASSAHAGLFNAQTGKIKDEAAISGDSSLPARQFRELTGMKLSDLSQEGRLQWAQNAAKGLSPQENLTTLRQSAKRDTAMAEARAVFESQYPKTLMGQRAPGAPDFLSFAEQYVAQKEGGTRVPQADAGRNAQGKIRGPGAPAAQQVARPKSQADFNALPKGAVYIDPDDGKSYRKR